MGNAYCVVKYTFDGRNYQTVHGIHTGIDQPNPENVFTEANLLNWGFNGLGVGDLDARTDVTNSPFNYASLLEAIISFHRFMQSPLVTLKQIYISDGFTLGAATGPFATFDLNLACQAPHLTVDPSAIAPANCALMIDKVSGQFSRRGGRMWLRGAMDKSHIRLGGEDGVELTFAGRTTVTDALTDFLTTGSVGGESSQKLADYFGDGAVGTDGVTNVQYSIVNTTKAVVNGKDRRVIFDWTKVATLAIDDAQSRDTRRRGPRKP